MAIIVTSVVCLQNVLQLSPVVIKAHKLSAANAGKGIPLKLKKKWMFTK